MISEYELKIIEKSYADYRRTGSRESFCVCTNGDELVFKGNAIDYLEELGYIEDVVELFAIYRFTITDKLIKYAKQHDL